MAKNDYQMYHPESFISPASEYGLLRAATRDRTVWLYARIPWSAALLDGANDRKREETASQLLRFFNGLAAQVPLSGMRYRAMLRGEYREFHILTGSMPVRYEPPRADGRNSRYQSLSRYQTYYYRNVKTRKQFAVIGVPLKFGGHEERHGRKKSLIRRAFTSYDRMCFSIANGYSMFDEYLPDARRIERIMLDAGLQPFTRMTAPERERMVSMMESWWVGRARSSALPVLAENDHLHFFPDTELCKTAKKLYDAGVDCEDWNIDYEYPASICFARSSDFEESMLTDPANLWIARLMECGSAGGANAVGVSIRGKVEPSKVTQDTIRRNQHAIDEAIKERYEKGREASGDMEELQARLSYKRSLYSIPDMPPTIIDLSIAACVAGNAQMAVDSLSRIPRIEFTNLTTANEQLLAFKSMQACSPVRMTPYEMHWTATTVAGGGVSSLARGGDENGALLGVTEANRQPVYIGTTTVQDKDTKPILAIIGDTGSGKAFTISTLLPVPPQYHFPLGGQVKLADLHEGDLVYGRDGKTYPILKLHPINTEDVYEVTLSDGQTFKTSGNHQWVVSSFKDRNAANRPNHRKAMERKTRLLEARDALYAIADSRPEGERLTASEIAELTEPTFRQWAGKTDAEKYVSGVMRFMSVPAVKEERAYEYNDSGERHAHTQNRKRYDPQEVLTLLIDHFDDVAHHAKRWREQAAHRTEILRGHLDDKFERGLAVTDIMSMLGDLAPSQASLTTLVRPLTPVSEWDEDTRTLKRGKSVKKYRTYDSRQAIRAIGDRMLIRYEKLLAVEDGTPEQVVTTRDMLDAGLKDSGGRAQWAIAATAPIEGVETDLPLDPWLLGAWLADGGTGRGGIVSDSHNGDIEHVERHAEQAGFKYRRIQSGDLKSTYITGLSKPLRELGIFNCKDIPEQYYSASYRQRLALVQGMLDQDGSIDTQGSVEFCQSADHEHLVRGMVRLLRSLGIVVHEPKFSSSGYRAKDGTRVECDGRWRIVFTTTLPVFTLPRKLARLPEKLRATQKWMYVTDIHKIEDEPHRCLTVGSPDHTFLVGDYVPTHNTMAAFSLFLQWSKIEGRDGKGRTPCVFINPKSGDDLEDAARSQGSPVIRLDSDVANGTFDPFNVMESREEAKEMASIMLSDILHPKGADTEDELALTAMLDYGIQHGAKSCGVALGMAAQAFKTLSEQGHNPEDEGLPANTPMVARQVNYAIKNYQSMRLIFGTSNNTQPLRLSQGLTLINAGERSLVPEPGSENTVTGRIQQWVLRMVVLGAGTAVRGRDGMVGLDEAWVAMGKGKGASKTLEQWVRMARSQRFTPLLATQKVQEFIDAGLTGGISRAILLALDNPDESNGTVSPAKSALRLLQIDDPSGRMVYRMGLGDVKDNNQPEPDSLKRLVDPDTKETTRGAVCYFKDGSKQPVPVEIIIPPDLLKEISTTATDKIAREKRKEQQQ